MRAVRFAAAAGVVLSTPWLLPNLTVPQLRQLFAAFPELTLAALAAAPLPGLVGALSGIRWLRQRPEEGAGPLAVATRWATILAIIGLARPFGPREPGEVATELLLRGGQLVGLLFLFDGPLVPEAAARPRWHRAGSGPRPPARASRRS